MERETPREKQTRLRREQRDQEFMTNNSLTRAGLLDFITKLQNAKTHGFETFEEFMASLSATTNTEGQTSSDSENFNAFDQIAKEWKKSGFDKTLKVIFRGGRLD